MKKTSTHFLNLWILALAVMGFQFDAGTYFHGLIHAQDSSPVQTAFLERQPANVDHAAPVSDDQLAEQLDALGLNIGMSHAENVPGSLNHCKSIVYKTLESLPAEDVAPLKHITLKFNQDGLRGQAGGANLVLQCVEMSDQELAGVLVHEMGHIVDTGLLEGTPESGDSEFMDGTMPVYKNDPSLAFYRLSFVTEKELKAEASPLDFVSGYAMSDPFEDLAESYNYYILHGVEFRKLLATSEVLAQKYDFLKTSIFHGKEYNNGDESNVLTTARPYDTTVLSYDMKKFFVL